MTGIHVNVVDLGEAAAAGAVRYNLPGRSVIAVHSGLPLDEQAALVTELTGDDEIPVYVNVPEPRQSEEDDQALGRRSTAAAHLHVPAAAASAVAAVAFRAPHVAG